ncbi:T9SS type A sorting domain-containing protein [Agriterribacter sp.]|uniref:T9SS type A sorting domain-containing protein n=1 Tax=Agriterribacter sp. TaxID=2821509 RepID=UPI002BFF7266|nr:T9SS type A sorting domain-containing protein [Agriterribacter sp.]HRP56818.1 T9SS type A sorting domain-containing protein [Agriterribacter sp.]
MSSLVRDMLFLFLPGITCLLLPFTGLSQTGPAAVQFSSFEAELLSKNTVQLKWGFVQQEGDNIHFIVERSSDGVAFHPLYKTGSSPGGNETAYQYTDHVIIKDSMFYRIAGQTGNGNETFSAIRKIHLPRRLKTEVVVMPNPVFNNASLIINDEGLGEISCILYDMTGKNIRSYQIRKTTTYMQQILDMYSVPKGEYILSIRGATINETKRIVKQ